MKDRRTALEADISAFLAAGGKIEACDSSQNAGAAAPHSLSRSELIALRKRMDGNAIRIARARRRGGEL